MPTTVLMPTMRLYSSMYVMPSFTDDDAPYETIIYLEEDADGATGVDAIFVFDHVKDTEVRAKVVEPLSLPLSVVDFVRSAKQMLSR